MLGVRSGSQVSTYRETTYHYYSTEDLLGRGATCEVFKGISQSGEYRALKIFSARASGKNSDIAREVEALKKLKHDNVVVFYSVEQDKLTGRPVVVTELCEDGSLQDVLNSLDFKYGLDEEEFLLVFRHLLNGVRHLRRNGFVHRDIKPGNILRCIDENGKSLYKLSDFGTARLLDDGDEFMSLVGTEEYLHPNLYNAAFLHPRCRGGFDAKVDLWSLGATLYHCCTGCVPFRPYGGRDDKKAMYAMLTRRPDGVIGGIQFKPGGEIGWIKELPPASSLSSGMKRLITPLLVGLLQVEESKAWTFDFFFEKADEILDKTAVNVLAIRPNPTWLYKIYLDPKNSFHDLQHQLEEQTGILQKDQVLFYQNECLKSEIMTSDDGGVSSIGACFPVTSLNRPIILLSRKVMNKLHKPCAYLDEIQSDVSLQFSDTMDLSYDVTIANMIGGHINILHKQVLISTSLQEHIIELERKQRHNFRRDFDVAKCRRSDVTELHDEIRHVIKKAEKQTGKDDIWSLAVDDLFYKNDELLKTVEEDLITAYEMLNDGDTFYNTDWCYGESASCVRKTARILTKAAKIIDRMTSRRQNLMLKTRKNRYDGLQHQADAKNLINLKDDIMKIWKNHCLPKTRTLQEKINAWSSAHLDASDKVHGSINLLEKIRKNSIKGLQLLRQESSSQEIEETPVNIYSTPLLRTHSQCASDLKILLTDGLPDIYQPDNLEDALTPMSILDTNPRSNVDTISIPYIDS
ncbi:serine/threonine-protein kinase TBK1 [Patella vulgata]|uniref:serine/threonine-protein kinase TBK1 n=1 Tax=Patella vulgata TaxID=6465 RepID=UPI00217F3CE8|nr:serine/threonine-protein kinase TBK1 [Patella vulgata]